MLFGSILNLQEYIDTQFTIEKQAFYRRTLSAGLKDSEKFIFDAILINEIFPTEKGGYLFGAYEDYGFSSTHNVFIPHYKFNYNSSLGNYTGGIELSFFNKAKVSDFSFYSKDRENDFKLIEIEKKDEILNKSIFSLLSNELFPNCEFDTSTEGGFINTKDVKFYVKLTISFDSNKYYVVIYLPFDFRNNAVLGEVDVKLTEAQIVSDSFIIDELVNL